MYWERNILLEIAGATSYIYENRYCQFGIQLTSRKILFSRSYLHCGLHLNLILIVEFV